MPMFMNKRVMVLPGTRKGWYVPLRFLVCMTIATIIACQLHTAWFASEHIAPVTHHQGSTSHAAGFASCALAVLPTSTLLIVLFAVRFLAEPFMLHSTLFSMHPVIPPQVRG